MTDFLINQEAESSFLSCILRYPESFWQINSVGLRSEDFMGVENKRIMHAICNVTADKKQPDLPLVLEELREAGTDTTERYLTRLMDIPCSIQQGIDHASVVYGLSINRQLQRAATRIIEIAGEQRADATESVAIAESEIRKIRNNLPESSRSPDPADIIRRLRESISLESTPIKFSDRLNAITGGYRPGHIWVVGGFSSTGKSAVACNMIHDAIQADKWVGMVSTEMTQENYMERMLSLLSGVPFRDIRDRTIVGIEAIDALRQAEKKMMNAPVRIYDDLYSIAQIRLKAQALKETIGLDLLLVDFIQNVRGTKGDFSYGDMTEVALELQQMAKDLRCTVVAFSQISNEMARYQTDGGDDNFYGFKGSGAIKDVADVAIMLKRDRVGQSTNLDFNMVKHRHGQLAVIPTQIELSTGRINEYSYD